MDIMKLLEFLEDIIETGTKLPAGKVIINKKEALNTIEQIINYLPDEFKKAQWLCEEKERILSESKDEAEAMKRESIDYLKRQIENHDIIKEASLKADEIVAKAQMDAKDIRLGARDYADEIVSDLEKSIDEKGSEMVNNISKELDSFITDLEKELSADLHSIRNNIKELRNYK